MKIKIKQVTSWKRAYDSALMTEGKVSDKEPSDIWKRKMLRAEHSPIRLVEYDIILDDIPYFVAMHLVRHKFGVEHFVRSQRPDRNANVKSRHDVTQDALVSMQISANAQALINISRKRLCNKASAETRQVWQAVKAEMVLIDACMASAMVPDCKYRGECAELKCCGKTLKTL